jgi:hypothetical protein
MLHALAKWLDLVLQPIVTTQPAYFKDLFSLKRELNELVLPPNARLITLDAVSMYTNINTDPCIDLISAYFATIPTIVDKHEYKAIIAAMNIVMRNNRMQFGDLIYHQIRGIPMGISPAPTIANLFVAIFELTIIIPLLNKYLFFYKRSSKTVLQSGYRTKTQ